MSQYSSLSRAQLSYDYLHTNSTTHEFLFGALAELIDNARDAEATKINIYATMDKSLRGGYMLCFLDDGEGMEQNDAADIVTFGRSSKRSHDSQLIGMYGNGLKSGSMRIGNDLIIFTKKGPVMTAVFLSRSFHEEEKIDEIIVPMPSFNSQSKKPLAKGKEEMQKHQLEMDLILKYSPFKTEAQFMREFDRIDKNSGTLVIIYNMKLLDNGDPELDVTTEAHDVLLANPDGGDFDSDEGLMPERKSFRAYTSVLYVDPRMKIYINSKKVRTKRLANCLYKPRLYHYSSNRFKTRSESEATKAKEEARAAENRAREAESKAKNLENKLGDKGTRDQRAELRKAQTNALLKRKEATLKKEMSERKMKSLRDPKSLRFIFGMNLENRSQDGMFVYNCSRLIKMYQRVGPQSDGGVFCSGVVGIVDVPYMVLEPTHNKQDFADAKEYRTLQKAMGEYMVQYWKDVGIATQGVTKFWESFGYLSTNWKERPSMDLKFVKKRLMQLQVTLQCDLCLKWRMLQFSLNSVGKDYPDDWICSMNPDPSHNRCSAAEQKLDIPEGVLKKEVKTKEQKEKELAEDIKKKQEMLEKMQTSKKVTVTSSRQSFEEDLKVEPRHTTRESVLRAVGRDLPKRDAVSSSRSSLGKSTISNRRRSQMSDSTGSDSDGLMDVDDDDEPPVKKSRSIARSSPKTYSRPSAPKSRSVSKPVRATSTTTSTSESRRASTRKLSEDESDEEKPAPRSRQSSSRNSKEVTASNGRSEKALEMTEPDDGVTAGLEDDETAQLGTKVEAKYQSKWCNGTITKVDKKNGKWKIKFIKYPQDKFDAWFDFDSADVKIIKSSAAESTVDTTRSPGSVSSQETANEAPSSSTTTTTTTAGSSQYSEDIANGYRTCLRYFLPPHWMMDKDAVSGLSTQELANFPLDDFFDHYEKGLRKLVSSFQMEAQQKQGEAEVARSKLSNVRKLIAKLLKTINEEFDIDPEADTEQVDDLLAACVKQALQQQPT